MIWERERKDAVEAKIKEDIDLDMKDGSQSMVDMVAAHLSGKTMSEIKQELNDKEQKNPHDARTKEAKAFLQRMGRK